MAAVMLASAGLIFAVVYIDTGSQLTRQTDLDLQGDVSQLVQALRPQAAVPTPVAYTAARKYVNAQPYSTTSTLLFVLIPGQQPVSSQPKVFGGAGATVVDAAARAAERRAAAALHDPRVGYSTERLPEVGKLRFLERRIRVGREAAVIGVAEPLAIVDRAQRGVARAFVLAAALSILLAVIASYFAGVRSTAPLRRMAAVAARIDAGELEPRMEVGHGRGEEVRVLADTFNHMLDRLEAAFASQRGFVADASHELRTPLTVIRGQLEVLAAQQNPGAAEVARVEAVVQAEVTRMSRLVDDLMLLTAADQDDFLRIERFDLGQFVTELWDGLGLTADRSFELGPLPAGELEADPDRLAQTVRNLARNAVEHTSSRSGLVRLEVEPLAGGRISFAVIDDGPGIPEEERDRVFERLYRIDQARSRSVGGAGLGLAIARAIAEAHGGEVHAGPRPGGRRGARIVLVLPRFHATPRPVVARSTGAPDAS